MTSGIYILTFNSGKVYIGKSNDIERRWKEHTNKFNKGTAAKNMQREFDIYGMPEFNILQECHSDHADLLESMHIESRWEELLNATQPSKISHEDKMIFADSYFELQESTADHLRKLAELTRECMVGKFAHQGAVEALEARYEELLDEKPLVRKVLEASSVLEDKLAEAEDDYISLKEQMLILEQESNAHILELQQRNHYLENRTFWQRLFG